jgi:hypothetical protein
VRQASLRDLPFAAALVHFAAWYAGLTPAQQLQVERAIREANEEMKPPPAAPQTLRPVATPPWDPPQAEWTAGVADPGDKVRRLLDRFQTLSTGRQKWIRDRLNKPEDAVEHLKGNPAWDDTRDWLTSFVAGSAEEQAALRTRIELPPAAGAAA